MAAYRNWTLRLPASLIEDLHRAAESGGVTVDDLVEQAVAEKVALLQGRRRLRDVPPEGRLAALHERATRGSPEEAARLLAKAGTTDAVLPGDELPEAWPDVSPHGPGDIATGRTPAA